MRFVFINKKLVFFTITALFILGIGSWYYFNPGDTETASMTKQTKSLEISMIAVEFQSKMTDGREIEVYRWDPGTIYIPKEEDVTLRIYGVNGKEHPFFIEGTNIKGVVKKGEETAIPLHFKEEGVYKLICTTHTSGAPMTAYIVVD
ncbi:hypothetical protein [Metabacillus fastidiosus]|uniref:hypothetical protein n=1 Tax=Metabacillus fastidiosus TaxID=1458 RepID=UPI002E20E902|nr:hypothetical protein [Metabacillus fastidiosus]